MLTLAVMCLGVCHHMQHVCAAFSALDGYAQTLHAYVMFEATA